MSKEEIKFDVPASIAVLEYWRVIASDHLICDVLSHFDFVVVLDIVIWKNGALVYFQDVARLIFCSM